MPVVAYLLPPAIELNTLSLPLFYIGGDNKINVALLAWGLDKWSILLLWEC
jgi:hypothetical protein